MGKLRVKGTALKYVDADKVDYTIEFVIKRKQQNDAIEILTKQVDLFLSKLKEIGIEPKDISLTKDSISNSDWANKDSGIQATRTLTITTPFDARINNYILKLIKDNCLDARISVDYSLYNYSKIAKELLSEATNNAKMKADAIASSQGMKVVGIETLADDNYSDKYHDRDDERADILGFGGFVGDVLLDDDSLSANLSSKRILVSERVNVEFQIEKL